MNIKYRIVETIAEEHIFQPQYKTFLLWKSFVEEITFNSFTRYCEFHDLKNAQDFLQVESEKPLISKNNWRNIYEWIPSIKKEDN